MLADVSAEIRKLNSENKRVLFEGAQGALLDVDQGTYPYVTSSNCSPAGIASGAGIGPHDIDYILGVVKAYVTRVGEGPMPSEIDDAIGEKIAIEGGEVGATTGRPRRCGWFDAVSVKRVIESNSVSALCLTKMDVLDFLDEIKICVDYRFTDDAEIFSECMDLETAQPEYISCKGWKQSIKGINKIEELPREAIDFYKKIEEVCGISVDVISTAPDDAGTIILNQIMICYLSSFVSINDKSHIEIIEFFSSKVSKVLFSFLLVIAFFFYTLTISEIFEDYLHDEQTKNVANKVLNLFAIVVPILTIITIYNFN